MLSLRAIDRAERPSRLEPLATELLRLPGLQRRERLRRERLVDLVEVEVLQRRASLPRASRTRRTRAPSAGPRRGRSRRPLRARR